MALQLQQLIKSWGTSKMRAFNQVNVQITRLHLEVLFILFIIILFSSQLTVLINYQWTQLLEWWTHDAYYRLLNIRVVHLMEQELAKLEHS